MAKVFTLVCGKCGASRKFESSKFSVSGFATDVRQQIDESGWYHAPEDENSRCADCGVADDK